MRRRHTPDTPDTPDTLRQRAAMVAVLLLGLLAMAPAAAFGQQYASSQDGASDPPPAVFVVGEDDTLEGSGVALRDAITFAPGDTAARYFAVIAPQTDRQVLLDADVSGPLVDRDQGVQVTVAGCDLATVADPAPADCDTWTGHATVPLAELSNLEVGVAQAGHARMVRLILALPENAPNELQGASTVATYTITAVDPTFDPQDPPDGPPPGDPPSGDPPPGADPGTDPGRLPRTGVAAVTIVAVALLLLAAGATAVVASARPSAGSTALARRPVTWVVVSAVLVVVLGVLATQSALAWFSAGDTSGVINVTTADDFN